MSVWSRGGGGGQVSVWIRGADRCPSGVGGGRTGVCLE